MDPQLDQVGIPAHTSTHRLWTTNDATNHGTVSVREPLP